MFVYQGLLSDSLTGHTMTAEDYNKAVKELTQIPGVGRAVADDLILMGVKHVSDLKNKDADKLYHKSNKLAGAVQDKSLLNTFRCAIDFASRKSQDKEMPEPHYSNAK
jgi:nucleotidyltransferase/DNA polymerase involved in DNA repair